MRSILLLQSGHNQIPKQSSDEPNIQTQTNQDHWYTGLKSREIEAEEWGIQEQTLRNLYRTDGLKLDDVRRLMYTQYGFYATVAQYKHRINTIWKIKKNVSRRKIFEKKQLERSQNKSGYSGADIVSVVASSCVSYQTQSANSNINISHKVCSQENTSATIESMLQISAPATFPQSPSLADDEPTSIRTHESSSLADTCLPAADMDIQTSPQFQEDETLSSDWIKCPSFSDLYNDIGDIFYDSELFLDALELYQDALAGREEEFDRHHPSILAILYSMGLSYFKLGDFERARGCLLQVLEAQETLLCKDHSAIQSTVKDLGRMCYENGDYEEAQRWYERVLAGAREL